MRRNAVAEGNGRGMVDEERYGIAELAEAADVSVRTVRYYIAEGLLPPAVTAGARSYYTGEHLARLRLIGRLKDAFLPLREIRRHLTDLDAETIRDLAEADAEPELPADAATVPEAIAREERADDSNPPAPAMPAPAEAPPLAWERPTVAPAPAERPRGSASDYIARVLGTPGRGAAPPPRPGPRPAPLPRAPVAPPKPPAGEALEATAWRRVPIGEDAELLIREDAYARRRDKVEWLVDWARKVLG